MIIITAKSHQSFSPKELNACESTMHTHVHAHTSTHTQHPSWKIWCRNGVCVFFSNNSLRAHLCRTPDLEPLSFLPGSLLITAVKVHSDINDNYVLYIHEDLNKRTSLCRENIPVAKHLHLSYQSSKGTWKQSPWKASLRAQSPPQDCKTSEPEYLWAWPPHISLNALVQHNFLKSNFIM